MVKAGVAGIVVSMLGRGPTEPAVAEASFTAALGACTVTDRAGKRTYHIGGLADGGLTFQEATIADILVGTTVLPITRSSTLAIARGGVSELSLNSAAVEHRGSKTARGTVHFGDEFQGIREIDFAIDGGTVRGTFDGRAIFPFPAASRPTSLEFQDGGPPPTITAAPGVQTAIAGLLKEAQAAAGRCVQTPTGGVGAPVDPSSACNDCLNKCQDDWIKCELESGPKCLAGIRSVAATMPSDVRATRKAATMIAISKGVRAARPNASTATGFPRTSAVPRPGFAPGR
jgi:hypothetical protein